MFLLIANIDSLLNKNVLYFLILELAKFCFKYEGITFSTMKCSKSTGFKRLNADFFAYEV